MRTDQPVDILLRNTTGKQEGQGQGWSVCVLPNVNFISQFKGLMAFSQNLD